MQRLPGANDGPLPSATSVAALAEAGHAHIDSFNYFLEQGLPTALAALPKRVARLTDGGPLVTTWLEDVRIGYPTRAAGSGGSDARLFPGECRERGLTYAAPMSATVCRVVGDDADAAVERYEARLGDLPVMVRSRRCHLAGLSPKELVAAHEEASEFGGYFICNGIERIIRMLQVPRRNHPMAMTRSAYTKRGPSYSDKGVSIRCVRPDQSGITITIHYLTTGAASLRFSLNKQEFFLPVALVAKALMPVTDRELYERLLAGNSGNTFLASCAELCLRAAATFQLRSQSDVLSYIGSRFRAILDMPDGISDLDAGNLLLDRFIFVHLDSNQDKFELLLFMLRKLYAFAKGDACHDNPDSLMNQELLLPGHLYTMFVKEQLGMYLFNLETAIKRDVRSGRSVDVYDGAYFKKMLERQADVGKKIYYLLATGNLVSQSGLDLMQVSGYTIVADKINFMRFLTHFRSVHRGQFFTEMKTTTVRKLLPETWGFVCPVHTPDGAPCGLLNHIASACKLVTEIHKTDGLPELLAELGMTPLIEGAVIPYTSLPVLLDGKVLGGIPAAAANRLASSIRLLKTANHRSVPKTMEVTVIPPAELVREDGTSVALKGPYPGIFLATKPARMIRPVIQLATGKIEYIGPMEQVYMNIAVMDVDIVQGVTTHRELSPMNMLSIAASLTPFSDLNQSPRNMYQCQMGKQTMGTPYHTFVYRADNKIYRLQTGQAALVQNQAGGKYGMDEYPSGTNAVVAVIAYTGFDMEDAMILNKSAYERGFGHASVYKAHTVDLTQFKRRGEALHLRFSNTKEDGSVAAPNLDADGLAYVGMRVKEGDPLYCVRDTITGRTKLGRHKDAEPAVVDEIRLLGTDGKAGTLDKVSIKLRYNRNPVIGDKFSSRHGQKGVLSVLFPQEDMPFTESGMSPDVIINPHAFPSRMTIGMLVESMAGKAGACHARFQDSTPFRFNERQRAVDYFGEELLKAGYNYYGSEPLYSGTTGEELRADIYIGVVYYQRLRHMVSDKAQVRGNEGPINDLTRQPVKGRKKHGGIRFGEMERDSLLAHGAAFLLHDRLMNCSDKHIAQVCKQCGSLISPMMQRAVVAAAGETMAERAPMKPTCRACNTGAHVVELALPYVFRYLVNELAAMNIRLTLTVS